MGRSWRGASWTAAIVATLGLAGCFVDIDNYYGTSAAPTTGGTSTGTSTGGTSTGVTTTASSSGTEASPTSSGAPTTDATSGSTTEAGTTAAPVSTTTGGPLCPAVDPFTGPHPKDPACEACLREQCCAEFTACSGACVEAWNCADAEGCLSKWPMCPGYDAHKPALDPAFACMNDKCTDACVPVGVCGEQGYACKVDAECQAIGTCVTDCAKGCPAMDNNCALACWGMCKDKHPNGAPEWDAFWACVSMQCG